MHTETLWQAVLLWWEQTAVLVLILSLLITALRLRRRFVTLLFRSGVIAPDREQTLGPIILSLSRWMIWISGVLGMLSALGADLWQVLTGASILGLALGLGAQNVVRDIIAGFFIMVENQFRPGDYVSINGDLEGRVEGLDLRMTRLRGWDGAVICIGNATITRVKNFNREAMRVIIYASVPFEADHRQVRLVLESLCAEMSETHREHFLEEGGALVEPPFLYGVTDINSSKGVGATYCVMGLTKVDAYWYVEREVRRMLLERLQMAAIHLSYPQRVYHPTTLLDPER
jgi:small-conductance mechanosensitive channel